MANVIIVGTQWGDEGKGKIVDIYAREADVVARFQGGNNAGHTLVVQGRQTILHLVPSGILHNHKTCILGNGMVVDPTILIREIDELREKDLFPPDTKLFISENAHLIMPYHRSLDGARETRQGAAKIGTTGKGIGPAYEDKIARTGIRFCDLLDSETFGELLRVNVEEKNFYLTNFYNDNPVEYNAIFNEYCAYADRLREYAANTSVIIDKAINNGCHILFEGAQGCHLDIDYGTYPFVTSSNTSAGSACCGSGIGPTRIDAVVGICKAYTTRVGEGPFVTELSGEMGERIQKAGAEFGATTGRKRRCGWIDMVLIRQSVRVSGITGIALTKLDVLTGIDKIQICVAYKTISGEFTEYVPSDIKLFEQCRPVYEEMDGWSEDISKAKTIGELPVNARRYISRLEELAGVKISLLSVGPGRDETIMLENPFDEFDSSER
ncbi:MAG: adenylosuccinate synthase [Thermodesulfobacteriota bacterium]|nr:adenylosuccinate synthase [Thermodesulfobacteriota bacterium]